MKGLHESKYFSHLVTYNVRKLTKIEQKSARAKIFGTLKIAIVTQNFNSIITPLSLDTTLISGFRLCVSDGRILSANNQTDVGIAVSIWEVRAPLDRIPVNNRLRPFWLNGSVPVNISRLKRFCLFVITLYTVNDCHNETTP